MCYNNYRVKEREVIEMIKSMLVIGAMVGVMTMVGTMESTYSMECRVDRVANETVTVVDTVGEAWCFTSDEVYTVGETVVVRWFNEDTPTNRYDDEIISVKKVGK